MAVITDTGITSTSLNEYKTQYETAFKNALGDDLDLDPQTPQGQMIGILALNSSVIDDALVLAFQQLNILDAAGNQLDAYGAQFDIERSSATRSKTIVTVTGVATTIIPQGSQAKTTNGDLFSATGNITIGGGGSGTGEFEAVDTGAIAIDANTLTQIVDVVSGWETIDNPSDGTLGEDRETDSEFRIDYFNKLQKNALSTTDAIRSNILSLDSVIDARVFENDTNNLVVKQDVGLLPHSIAVVVEGGIPQLIGQTIADTKTLGADTEGDDTNIQTEVTALTNEGLTSIQIFFYPVEFVLTNISVEVQEFTEVPDLVNRIKTAIIDYFNGTFSSSIPPIGISDTSFLSRLYTPINSIEGFDVVFLTQEIAGSGTPESAIIPSLNQRLIVALDSIFITLL
ncbi:MAG: baseplate J/gp47 family protein [Gammaproteobacteria bacterium]